MHCRALLGVLLLARRRRCDGQRLRMVVAPFPNLPLLPEGIFLLLNAVTQFSFRPLEPDVEFVVLVRNRRERRGDGVEEPPAWAAMR